MPETKIVEVCTMVDIGMEIKGKDAPPIIAAINRYLEAFAKPIRKEGGGFLVGGLECLSCGRALNGALGTFEWGIASGEGTCSNCNWPARAHHRPKDEDGDMIFDRALEIILQYHPNHVTTTKEDDA